MSKSPYSVFSDMYSSETIKIQIEQKSVDGDVVNVIRTSSCGNLKSVIKDYIPELLVELDQDGSLLGDIFMYDAAFGLRILSLDPTKDLRVFANAYSETIIIQLSLMLIRGRLQDRNISIENVICHSEAIKDAVFFMQTNFDRSMLSSFVKRVKSKIDFKTTEILKLALKSYVKHYRKSISDGVSTEEIFEIAILMRVATEVLSLTNEASRSPDSVREMLDHMDKSDYNKPVFVRGWPKVDVYHREIRDPRYRKFRS